MDLLLPTWSLLLEFVLLGLSGQVYPQMRRCRYQSRPHRRQYDMVGAVNGSEQHCFYTNCCLALYLITDHGELEVDTLACYLRYKTCSEDACTRVNHFLHCVCNGDLCNNVTSWTREGEKKPVPLQNSNDAVLVVGLLTPLLVLCVAAFTLKYICKKTTKLRSPVDPLCEPKAADITDVELLKELRRGTFAAVWQGRFKGAPVAVKVFPKAWRHKFLAEREVHQLLETGHPHPNMVQYLVAGSIGACWSSGPFAIVLEYAAHGSLHSYLSEHVSSWTSCLTLCQSLSQGLSHLHKQDIHKPPVAHGDLSSSNVLVKADGTCALCDFGCSTILRPGHFTGTQAARGKGTLLYMSPEILEGSVMFNDSWHLQADVYSLGLVLWEVWMRCFDLFGESVPPHLLPYEQELRPSVTLEGLLQLVLFSEQRPAIPEVWQQHPQGAAVADLLSCCWDADADARLSASCAADRLASF